MSMRQNISRPRRQDHAGPHPPGLCITLRRKGLDNNPVEITWGTAPAWFGECLIASTADGICWLDPAPRAGMLARLEKVWAPAILERNDALAADLAARLTGDAAGRLSLQLCGTEFQLRVWQILLGIRPGNYMSYGQIARAVGAPGAARAVGGAVGANGIAMLVPCHRVLPDSGGVGAYRWGVELKIAMLQRERHAMGLGAVA